MAGSKELQTNTSQSICLGEDCEEPGWQKLCAHQTPNTPNSHSPFPSGPYAPWDVGDGDTKKPPGGLLTPAFNPHCAATETPKSQGLSTGQVICGDQENQFASIVTDVLKTGYCED